MSDLTVFVIDDVEEVRESLAVLLETSGYRVETFPSALAFLAAYRPSWRGCVVADVMMPEMSGPELQQELALRSIALPLIMITGHGDIPMAVAALKAGAVDFIEKPFREEVLVRAIDEGLRRADSPDAAATPDFAERFANLTAREMDVLHLLVAGHPNKVVADRLGISSRTVEVHRARIMEKTEARNLADLVRMAYAFEKSRESGDM